MNGNMELLVHITSSDYPLIYDTKTMGPGLYDTRTIGPGPASLPDPARTLLSDQYSPMPELDFKTPPAVLTHHSLSPLTSGLLTHNLILPLETLLSELTTPLALAAY